MDAPCTASGLIQKKPEILIRNKEINLEKLISKQERLLDHAAKILKVGGYIVYCVCSINSREGVNQIESFLKNNLNFTTINLNQKITNFGKILGKGMLLIAPDETKIHLIPHLCVWCC